MTESNNAQFDYAGKIAALLKKAESTSSAEEADACEAAAERLMVKYGIDRAIIEAKKIAAGANAKPEEIVHRTVKFQGAYSQALVFMTGNVCRGLGNVRMYTYSSGKQDAMGNSTCVIVGFESDADQAVILVNSLALQGAGGLTRWWKSYVLSGEFAGRADSKAHLALTGSIKFRMRREFVISFGAGAAERLINARRVAMGEASDKPGTELAVRDRTKAVETYMDGMKLGKSRSIAGGGFEARAAGTAAGRNANVGEKQVGRSSAPAASSRALGA